MQVRYPFMRHVPHDNLRALIREIVHAAGSDGPEPRIVSDNLVDANLTGHDSHGVQMIPIYMNAVRSGVLVPNRHAEIVQDHGAVLTIDGLAGYGQVIGIEAMRIGIERAREHGVCVVALRNSFHLSRIGAWAEQCAAAGMVSLHHVNVIGNIGLVAPYGGTEARYSTNPWACALPATGNNPAFVADFATSLIAMGKVRVASNEGRELPEGALFDANGKPTRDPQAMLTEPRGALRPVGGHKGYCLALANEFLAGALTGGGTGRPGNRRDAYAAINNMLSIIIDPGRLAGEREMKTEMDAAIDHVRSSSREDPDQPILMPGEPERQSRAERLETGIPIPDPAWRELVRAGEMMGVAEARADALIAGS